MIPAPNERFEGVVVELAQVIGDEHYWDCHHEERDSFCGHDRARAVLAYLHGAGLIWWGANRNPIPPLSVSGSTVEPYALRLMGEFWHAVEETPEDVEAGRCRYEWLPGVLAVHGGYPGRSETAVRTFLDDLSKEQRTRLVPLLSAVLAELSPPVATEAARLSLYELQEMCDVVRARLMYDRSRGISTYEAGAWMCLGWDVGHRDGINLSHPSQAVSRIFNAPAWRPTLEELTWFRNGFARQREGSPRPTTRG